MLAAASTHAQAFDWNTLSQLARTRAQAPYNANSDKLPADLAALDYDQVRDIRFRPEQSLWRTEKRPFEAQFFHLGLYQTQPVRIHEITPEGVRHLPYRGTDFHFGRNTVDAKAWGDLGHAGFRLHHQYRSTQDPTIKLAHSETLIISALAEAAGSPLALDCCWGRRGRSRRAPGASAPVSRSRLTS